MIISSINILCEKDKKNDILEILSSVKGPTEGRAGCISCCIYEDIKDSNNVYYVEVWKNEEALRRHIHSKNYRNILAVIDMSCKRPDIKFSQIFAEDGISFIERSLIEKINRYPIECGI